MRARVAGVGFGAGRRRVRLLSASSIGRPRIGSQRGDDVGGFGHQRRALLEQAVGAFGARIERRARHGEHLAALFVRPSAR